MPPTTEQLDFLLANDKFSHPNNIILFAEAIGLGNPSRTRDHQNTPNSTLPGGKTGWGLGLRLGLPQAIL